MTKNLFAIAIVVTAAFGTGYATYPVEMREYVMEASKVAERLWQNTVANPVPVLVALGTFVLTIAYHTMRGKALRESVEVAATRVAVVPLPAQAETPVMARAKARATRAQLIADQIALESKLRKLPAELRQAEKDACYTEQAVADTRKALELKETAHADAVELLELLREEQAEGEAELGAIAEELQKLADVV